MPQIKCEIVRCYLIILFLTLTGGVFSLSAQTPLVTGEVNKYSHVTTVGANYVVVDNVSDFAAVIP